MVTHVSGAVAGLTVPDTPLARDITDYVREAEDDLLFDHSRRVYFFGALQGRRRGLEPDPELLYAGAMFHDVGLTDDGDRGTGDGLSRHGIEHVRRGDGLVGHRAEGSVGGDGGEVLLHDVRRIRRRRGVPRRDRGP